MRVDRDVRLYRIGCGAAMVAGSALFFVDNLIHPEELGRGNEAAQLAAIAPDPATAAIALHEVQQSAWSAPYYALTALWGAALVTLAWAAARAGVLGPAPAALLALGTIAVGLEGVVQDNTYFIASSALLLLGGAWAGVAILRLDDAAFAVGRHH